ncbi:MAG: DMT family transporter [Alphaproteobacteria bacterium]|nr:DMT family transporter [Alphaproteobacteria bacterium]MBU1550434.1 DMT family transporter [Alphaproteobacteria bacterium]MBU2338570.1 DMT family transporter [Alphaproteobacteria bacterium]MBU2389210.1 DMT family transporter [Alphaproteobacteria bacterium]
MTRLQANLVLLLAAAIWGGGFVAQSTAMAKIGPFWFVGLRFAIAAIAVLPFALMEARKSARPVTTGEWLSFATVGMALFGGAITQQVGLLTTTVTNSSFLTGLYVVFVPVISVIALRRYPHWIIWPGAGLSLTGIFLLSGGQLGNLTQGDLLSIVCAFFWGIQIILAGLFVTTTGRPLALSLTQFAICSLCCLVIAPFVEPISIEAILSAGREILYVGVISSGLAFVLQVIGQRYTTAPQAAIFLSSEALFGGLLGALLLGEILPPAGYLGCAIIFSAMIMVEIVPELSRRRSSLPKT